MIVLGVETSCDDTAAAVLKVGGKKSPCFKILSNVVSSQIKLHQKYGGVYPALAKREHQRNLPIVLKKVLKKAGNPRIDLIAVTAGPGLEPCLWVGVNFAKELAEKLKVPLVPVNHIEGHIAANFIGKTKPYTLNPKPFPAIVLIVSGGHTQLILMKNIGKYRIIGETRDDAAGECFDKTARILGLGYPGGPAISARAAKLKTINYKLKTNLPHPMMHQKNYDFSFSGLKTAVLYKVKSEKRSSQNSVLLTPQRRLRQAKNKAYINAMAFEIQQAIIDVLIHKTIKAAKGFKAKSIILGGGVTANNKLRKQFKVQSLRFRVNFSVPPKNLCTDNAAMIATTGYYKWLRSKTKKWKNIKADANLRIDKSL